MGMVNAVKANEENEIRIPIDPLLHEWFMCAARQFDFDVSISNGEYVVQYEDAVDLYHFGLAMRYQPKDVISDRCRLPVCNSERQPRKNQKKSGNNNSSIF